MLRIINKNSENENEIEGLRKTKNDPLPQKRNKISKRKRRRRRRRSCQSVDFAASTDYKVNEKGGEKPDKYLDLARELKILWYVKVTVISIVTGALGT